MCFRLTVSQNSGLILNRRRRPTQRAADPRSALVKRASLARKRSGQRPSLPRPARAADAHVSRQN
jgi:hypothetical protein